MDTKPKPVAWSYSRLSSFETCPKKYHEESVLKNYPFVDSEQARYGNYVHKKFERFLKRQEALPLDLKHWTTTLQHFANAPGEKQVEERITLNPAYDLVDWFAPDAWLRVVSDLTIVNDSTAVLIDYKTGKPRDNDGTQLKLNAAVTFLLNPDVQEVRAAYLWTQTKSIEPIVMKASETADFWGSVLPRVYRYTAAHEAQDFPARPGWICRFCPVKSCSFHP